MRRDDRSKYETAAHERDVRRRLLPRPCLVCDFPTIGRRSVEAWAVPWCRDEDGDDAHSDHAVQAEMTLTGVRFEVVDPDGEIL